MATKATLPVDTTREVDPISRIEGHLGVKVNIDASGLIDDAEVHGNLFRGFENFLLGREPNDAITFTQRICGVCPIPHATASTFAVEAAMGANANFHTFEYDAVTNQGVPAKAVIVRNLVYASEFVMSNITHFYHLAAPSYIQGPPIPPWTPYFFDDFYHPLLLSDPKVLPVKTTAGIDESLHFSSDLWSAIITSYVKALRIRRLTFEAGALFAGRMPMTSSFVAGGVTVNKDEVLDTKISTFRELMVEVGTFVVHELVPINLALGALYPNFDNLANATLLSTAALPLWEMMNGAANLPTAVNTGYGAGCKNFLAWGAFPGLAPYGDLAAAAVNDHLSMDRGYKLEAGSVTFISETDVVTNLREHTSFSYYTDYNDDKYPGAVNHTEPDRSSLTGYSWIKAPRWAGAPMEVGPYARMVVNGFYPVDDSTLTAFPGYTAYVSPHDAAGLDYLMVGLDIAVALVRSGLATVEGDTLNVTSAEIDDTLASFADAAAFLGALADDHAYIGGIIAAWVLGLVGGYSTIDRLRGRALETLFLVQEMIGSVGKDASGPTFATRAEVTGELVTFDVDTKSLGQTDVRRGSVAVTDGADITYIEGYDYTVDYAAGTITQLASPGRIAGGAVEIDFAHGGGGGWLGDLGALPAGAASYRNYAVPTYARSGFGVSEAPRGALAHFCSIDDGIITAYQCVVPTTWNASPHGVDAADLGPIEAALIGVPFDEYVYNATTEGTTVASGPSDSAEAVADPGNTYSGGAVFEKSVGTAMVVSAGGVESLRVAQSFDPCIACAIH